MLNVDPCCARGFGCGNRCLETVARNAERRGRSRITCCSALGYLYRANSPTWSRALHMLQSALAMPSPSGQSSKSNINSASHILRRLGTCHFCRGPTTREHPSVEDSCNRQAALISTAGETEVDSRLAYLGYKCRSSPLSLCNQLRNIPLNSRYLFTHVSFPASCIHESA
jgi:hypothetical protein